MDSTLGIKDVSKVVAKYYFFRLDSCFTDPEFIWFVITSFMLVEMKSVIMCCPLVFTER